MGDVTRYAPYKYRMTEDDRGGYVDYEDHAAEIARLTDIIKSLQGVIKAQDERERLAGDKCGVEYKYSGCDWPDWVSDKVIELTGEVERLWGHADEYHRQLVAIAEFLGDGPTGEGEVPSIVSIQKIQQQRDQALARVSELERRLAEEIKWGHRNCSLGNCESSGTDCPAQINANP